MLGISTPRSPPLPAAWLTLHPSPMPIPADGGPTGWRLHVDLSGCSRPGPMCQGPATRSPPRSGSKRGSRFSFSGRGSTTLFSPIHKGPVNRSWSGSSPGTTLPWETLPRANGPNNTAPRVTGHTKPSARLRWRFIGGEIHWRDDMISIFNF